MILSEVSQNRITRAFPGLLLVAFLAGWGSSAFAQRPPIVAAASDLNFALTEIAQQFARERGQRVDLVFGSSGTLVRQVRDGAPFELFLSADEAFVDDLAAAGLTRDTGTLYAIGRIVCFAPAGSPLIPSGSLDGLAELLAAGRVTRFAIANPEHSPYGRAAEAALRKRGLWNDLQPHLVLGDNVSQAAQFATTGNASGGLVAYSLVLGPGFSDRGKYAVIPEPDHPPLRQRMVLLKRASAPVEQFYKYLQTEPARAVFRKHGYGVPH